MTDFNKRGAEVFALILDFVGFGTGSGYGATSGPARVDPLGVTLDADVQRKLDESAAQERSQFMSKVPDYFVARQTRLNELITAMDAVFSGGRDPDPIWRQAVQNLLDDWQRQLGSLLTGIDKPTPRALTLRWKIQAEEKLFVQTLMDVGVAKTWEELARLHQSVLVMMNTLRVAWESILGKMRELDERARLPADSMRTAMENSVGFSNRFTVSTLKTAATNLGAIAGASEPLADIRRKAEAELSALDLFVSATAEADSLRRLYDVYRGGLGELSYLQESETGGVHAIYRQQRVDPMAMVRDPTVPAKARALVDTAKSRLASWKSSLPTSAMQTEAEDLGAALGRQLDGVVALVDKIYAEFYSQFDGRFFGTLTDYPVSMLMYSEAWSARAKAIANPAYVAAFRKILSDLDWDFAQDVDSKLATLIDAVGLRSAETVNAADRDALARDLKARRDALATKLRARRDGMRPVLQDLIAILEGSALAKVLDRKAVENAMRVN